MPDQFNNPANPRMHYRITGPEIWQQTEGKMHGFVAGVGTGGTISGVGKYLKEQDASVHVAAVEPSASPVLSGGKAGPHKIQGIGAGFVPENVNRAVIDEILTISNESAFEQAQQLARQEGILCGISSGAALAGVLALAAQERFQGKRIVCVLPDTGERYLSTDLIS
jgi:cysteine synthase A